jgi:hypothetical protein
VGDRHDVKAKWPVPTRADHHRFCETEGWTQVRNARGKTGGHHLTYELTLQDGRILRTRISHPPDRSTYGASLWSHILRDQLDVDERTFWACVNEATVPDRGEPLSPPETLPAGLVAVLLHQVGLSEAQVALMTKGEAIARVNQFWTTGA